MLKRTHFLKDDETLEKIKTILEDKDFSISKYWIKPSYIIEKLEKKSKIQVSSAYKILAIYNDYYKSYFQIDDLFNNKMLINYIIEYKFDFYFSSSLESESYLRNWVKIVMGSNRTSEPFYWNNTDKKEKLITINPVKIIFNIILIGLLIWGWVYIYNLVTL